MAHAKTTDLTKMPVGTLLAGRYRLVAEPGRGGVGVVNRAHDTLLDRDVAIKVLLHASLSTENCTHLLREARAAARLNHPNIVAVYDVGEADAAGGVPFIVMELVTGESLHSHPPRPWMGSCRLHDRYVPRSNTLTLTTSSTATSSQRTC